MHSILQNINKQIYHISSIVFLGSKLPIHVWKWNQILLDLGNITASDPNNKSTQRIDLLSNNSESKRNKIKKYLLICTFVFYKKWRIDRIKTATKQTVPDALSFKQREYSCTKWAFNTFWVFHNKHKKTKKFVRTIEIDKYNLRTIFDSEKHTSTTRWNEAFYQPK